jgi:hypothetical protein
MAEWMFSNIEDKQQGLKGTQAYSFCLTLKKKKTGKENVSTAKKSTEPLGHLFSPSTYHHDS